MNQADSSYGRLASAWQPRSAASTLHRPLIDALVRPASASECPPRSPHRDSSVQSPNVPWVLAARTGGRPLGAFECGLLASAAQDDRVFRLDPIEANCLDDVEHRCQEHAPRVLVIDIALLQGADPRDLQHLRRRLPGTEWLIGWDRPPAMLDLTVLGGARGCISWSSTGGALTRALDAVLAGELWFPRAVVESLYLALLDSVEGTMTTVEDESLTAREAEVLALMRKGLSNKQIAERLDISVNTVKKHLAHVFEKRGLHGRRQALD